MAGQMEEDSMATEAPLAPITIQRKIRNDLEESLPKPYLARALVAADTNSPDGTLGHRHQGMSVLQQHCAFFDQDNDGVVYPWETYVGLRAIGFGVIFSLLLSVGINMPLCLVTSPGWIPSLRLPIYIKNIHKAKHGSDTGSYDTEGRFVGANFENMFSKYARTVPEKMNAKELWDMTEGNRNAYDFLGGIGNKFEWFMFYGIAKDADGFVSKEAMRRVFDGSFFEFIARKKMGADKKMD